MRVSIPETLERGRVRTGMFASSPSDGFMGAFQLVGPCSRALPYHRRQYRDVGTRLRQY